MLDLYSIVDNSHRKISSLVNQEEKFLAEMTVSITSTLQQVSENNGLLREINIYFRRNKKRNLLNLAMISWFLPKEVGSLLRYTILNKVENSIGFHDVRFICTKKINLKFYLIKVVQEKGPQHLFGNTLNLEELRKSLHSIKIKIKNPNVGPVAQKRTIGVGYRDKGHLPDNSSWLPKKDYTWDELQQRIYNNRDFNKLSDILTEESYY